MGRKITLNIKGESSKQYSTLVLELNLLAKNWNRFGVDITLPGQEKLLNGVRRQVKTPQRNHHSNGKISK